MYLKFNQKIITDFSDNNITSLYNEGYVFTRVDKGIMNQTRSLRINLSKFELSSENKRILKKTENLQLETISLPYSNYNWQIGKLAKDFYETKFGKGIFSANKIKELLTDKEKSNFNLLLMYQTPPLNLPLKDGETANNCPILSEEGRGEVLGYAICRETNELLHYSYPFYSLLASPKTTSEGGLHTPYSLGKNTGLGMMIRAIVWAKESGKKYVYLGSASRPTDTYKLQFKGVEWFDENKWSDDFEKLKNILK